MYKFFVLLAIFLISERVFGIDGFPRDNQYVISQHVVYTDEMGMHDEQWSVYLTYAAIDSGKKLPVVVMDVYDYKAKTVTYKYVVYHLGDDSTYYRDGETWSPLDYVIPGSTECKSMMRDYSWNKGVVTVFSGIVWIKKNGYFVPTLRYCKS